MFSIYRGHWDTIDVNANVCHAFPPLRYWRVQDHRKHPNTIRWRWQRLSSSPESAGIVVIFIPGPSSGGATNARPARPTSPCLYTTGIYIPDLRQHSASCVRSVSPAGRLNEITAILADTSADGCATVAIAVAPPRH